MRASQLFVFSAAIFGFQAAGWDPIELTAPNPAQPHVLLIRDGLNLIFWGQKWTFCLPRLALEAADPSGVWAVVDRKPLEAKKRQPQRDVTIKKKEPYLFRIVDRDCKTPLKKLKRLELRERIGFFDEQGPFSLEIFGAESDAIHVSAEQTTPTKILWRDDPQTVDDRTFYASLSTPRLESRVVPLEVSVRQARWMSRALVLDDLWKDTVMDHPEWERARRVANTLSDKDPVHFILRFHPQDSADDELKALEDKVNARATRLLSKEKFRPVIHLTEVIPRGTYQLILSYDEPKWLAATAAFRGRFVSERHNLKELSSNTVTELEKIERDAESAAGPWFQEASFWMNDRPLSWEASKRLAPYRLHAGDDRVLLKVIDGRYIVRATFDVNWTGKPASKPMVINPYYLSARKHAWKKYVVRVSGP
jgi:hypothetical protein